MLTISFVGSPGAGKTRAMRLLHAQLGGELSQDGPILELRTVVPEVGPVAAYAVPGEVADPAPLERIVGRADALIFVVDTRPKRLEATKAAWLGNHSLLQRAGHAGIFPTILLYGHRDHPEAMALTEIDKTLYIHATIGELLPIPNAAALRFPSRHEQVEPAFAAALRAAVDGPFQIPPDALQFLQAKHDRQLAAEIVPWVPGLPDAQRVVKQMLRGDAGAKERVHEAVHAGEEQQLERLLGSSEFLATFERHVQDRIGSTLMVSNVTCADCKTSLGPVALLGTSGGPFQVGGPIVLDLDRLVAYHDVLLRVPRKDEPIVWLTGRACIECRAWRWCTVTIAEGRIASVGPATLNRAMYRAAHIVSRDGVQREAERRFGNAVDELTRAGVLAVLEQL